MILYSQTLKDIATTPEKLHEEVDDAHSDRRIFFKYYYKVLRP